ncbi:Lysophospholipase-like protein 1 [Holothuria leucospilota]|uniref:palmitoyl-protein hydrolase n=1 Tax=Holothuria leucospilota TaxID=206669 RepID=A0A9Q1HLW9_HOLLE|nr:Lysophospholipase-like protein 1 [Holothuria leucospilota]
MGQYELLRYNLFCISGDTGDGVRGWIKMLLARDLEIKNTKIIFPTAPLRPYTPMNGAMSTVWYDRKKIAPTVPECADEIEDSCKEVGKIIKQEIDSGIPKNKIVIGNIHFFHLKWCLPLFLVVKMFLTIDPLPSSSYKGLWDKAIVKGCVTCHQKELFHLSVKELTHPIKDPLELCYIFYRSQNILLQSLIVSEETRCKNNDVECCTVLRFLLLALYKLSLID